MVKVCIFFNNISCSVGIGIGPFYDGWNRILSDSARAVQHVEWKFLNCMIVIDLRLIYLFLSFGYCDFQKDMFQNGAQGRNILLVHFIRSVIQF